MIPRLEMGEISPRAEGNDEAPEAFGSGHSGAPSPEIEPPRPARPGKHRLLIDAANPHATVDALRDILAQCGDLYDRGGPVRLAFDQTQGGTVAQPMTPITLALISHRVCRPYVATKREGLVFEEDAPLPRYVASMYLAARGEWRLPPLNGIASTPLLREDGAIHCVAGYDRDTGIWLENLPDVGAQVPKNPRRDEALRALSTVREAVRTFCFADAETALGPDGADQVDTSRPPGRDESAALAALLTATCRPSLDLAPGILLRAASISGAGVGKGLLAHCICETAFGRGPHAITGGANMEELEKRVAAELIEGPAALFLDNLNDTFLKSVFLASVLTERRARVRLLGRSRMVALHPSCLIVVTGNGLSVSEDLARRFITITLDPKTEEPEARSFSTDVLAEVRANRHELLVALLTIWRWGRLNVGLQRGRVLGNFERWGEWVRDPLLSLGCQDPTDCVAEAKQRDGHRQIIAELFRVWWERHSDRPVSVARLHEDVRSALDSQRRGRQFIAARLEKLAGTRIAGFVLTRQPPAGKWGASTYALIPTADEVLRDRSAERPEISQRAGSEAPYAPDGSGLSDGASRDDGIVVHEPAECSGNE